MSRVPPTNVLVDDLLPKDWQKLVHDLMDEMAPIEALRALEAELPLATDEQWTYMAYMVGSINEARGQAYEKVQKALGQQIESFMAHREQNAG